MKLMTIVGARPNFMKAAPILSAVSAWNQTAGGFQESNRIDSILIHTGQHYDYKMSESFFEDLGMPRPDIHLNVGSASHAIQTAEIMRRFEEVLEQQRPDVLTLVGDVNSTVACALVAAKASYDGMGKRPLIAHVEAGLRSFDRSMPEEINRIVTDHLSDLLFVSEASGLRNLAQEGIAASKMFFVGNTMIDSLVTHRKKAEASTILDELGLRPPGSQGAMRYALLTLHRPANVDRRETFLNILDGLCELARDYAIVFPAHPRTRNRIRELGLEGYFNLTGLPGDGPPPAGRIHVIEPLGYLDFLNLMQNAIVVVTDSGGIQEETTCLRVPCVTVRENTERPVTVEEGTNRLAGVRADGIRRAIQEHLRSSVSGTIPQNWDGRSAERIVETLARVHRQELQRSGAVPPRGAVMQVGARAAVVLHSR